MPGLFKGPGKLNREASRLGDVGSEDPYPGIAPGSGLTAPNNGAVETVMLHRNTT
jgi:hypothetical protein